MKDSFYLRYFMQFSQLSEIVKEVPLKWFDFFLGTGSASVINKNIIHILKN